MQQIKIAVTGGIGSGKSTAMRCLQEMGYSVFSCDEIYREISLEEEYIQEIANVFPEAVINGKIERTILAKTVFDDPQKRARLNELSHSLIMNRLFECMGNCQSELVFAEVPLLFEGKYENDFDKILVIARDLQDRINSVQERDSIKKEEIKKRIAVQFDYDSLEGHARINACNAIIIENIGSIEDMRKQLQIFIQNIQ